MSIDRIITPGPMPNRDAMSVQPKPESKPDFDFTPKPRPGTRSDDPPAAAAARTNASADEEAGDGVKQLVGKRPVGPGLPPRPTNGPLPSHMPPAPLPSPVPPGISVRPPIPSDAQIQVATAQFLEETYGVTVGDLTPAEWETLTEAVEAIAQPTMMQSPPFVPQSPLPGLSAILEQLDSLGVNTGALVPKPVHR